MAFVAESMGEDAVPAGLRKVLVVDDSLVVRRVMQKDLEADGLEVETATDGVHALEVLEKSTCDIALVDIEMPRMNGYELLQHLREDPRYAGLPVIIVTSRSGEQHRQRAMELGADGYITKPYDVDQLDQMMRKAIASRHCSALMQVLTVKAAGFQLLLPVNMVAQITGKLPVQPGHLEIAGARGIHPVA